ncbi:MAG TPA: metallophosphoesterase [Thermoanaerobaculia bacterium]|jgi:3',5'-cyclic AMP phosphodiesterase CpdA|nr:metallophosphoesterase [Thermoanaerobaculia bacterium]
MKLWAIADLHLRYQATRDLLAALPAYPDDWLIVAGDVGETEGHLRFGLDLLSRRFARLLWVPGNHELWTIPPHPEEPRGDAKYRRLVAICRDYGVLTPEDPFVTWPGAGPPCVLAPLFLLYDYTFRPLGVPQEEAIAWAAEDNLLCSDEVLLHSDPYPDKPGWCAARCQDAERRLAAAAAQGPVVLINHYPLRYDLAVLPRIPRFSIWCGTRRTEDWHRRFNAHAVVYGHLHIRGTYDRDGVRCEEVSLGYPQNYDASRPVASYLREILPGPAAPRGTGAPLPDVSASRAG